MEVWASKDGRGRKLLFEGCGSFLIWSANSVCGVVEVRASFGLRVVGLLFQFGLWIL